ncbi:DUF721 domain-containing protein [Streptomyces sp. NPDC086023]|uniref:DUF721 domain-containing protein n=1 Tax=Streptomyces sp. NPDC086023 TaxID=3365746 RepID=UPI0037D93D2B
MTDGDGKAGGGEEPRKVPEPSGVDLARQALAAAKEAARARGQAVGKDRKKQRGGLRSGARADGRDPMRLGTALSRLQTEHGWENPLAVAGVMRRWPELVGPELARHCVPLKYEDDPDKRELHVQCDSDAWAAQLRMLSAQLVARLNEDLGQGTVRLIKVLSPNTGRPSYSGRLRAPGTTRNDGNRG